MVLNIALPRAEPSELGVNEPLSSNTACVIFTSMTAKSEANALVWLGIDVGTQGVRVVALDGHGDVLAGGRADLPPGTREAGRHEQHPQTWWDALCQASRAALAPLPGTPVAGVCIDSTSGTLVVQDRQGRSRGAALMYDDARAVDQAPRVQAAGADIWAALGFRMQPTWALPRVSWLVQHDAVGASDQIVHQGDHLAGRLVGAPVATDTSSALKTGFDTRSMRWPAEVHEALGIRPGLLPDVVLPGTPIGQVGAAGAADSGIPEGTPVLAGTTDGCAAQIASGALTPGSWSSALGTTLTIKGASDTLVLDPEGSIYCHPNPDGGWLPGGASNTGAGVLTSLFTAGDLPALTADLPPFPVEGFSYPLSGQGERFPFTCAEARSTLTQTQGASGLAAVMQGVAFAERLAYDVLRGLGADTSGPVAFSGGATRNAVWNQLRCDVLQRPVVLPVSTEAAVGAAILAAAPPGGLAATASRMVRRAQELHPTSDGARLESLTRAYERFLTRLVELGWLAPDRADRAEHAQPHGRVRS